LPANTRSFTDVNARNVNYYQVCAISKSALAYCSFPSLIQLPDSIPPIVPLGIKGSIDSSGVVVLTWLKNTEPDLLSYKVYRSNDPELDFVLANTEVINDTIFTDTIPLNNLSRVVYYSVTAQDRNYNESERSIPLAVNKPDTIPPVAPVIKNYSAAATSINIEWIASSSEDVVRHDIYRKKEGDKEWSLIARISQVQQINTFTDSLLMMDMNYGYLILAVDANGLESEGSKPLAVKTSVSAGPSAITYKLKRSNDGTTVTISWAAKVQDIDRILIYRAIDNENFTLYRTIKFVLKEFDDTGIKLGHTYLYRFMEVNGKGIKSKISDN
jgi:fibronectin type 3 domain-containing protein